MEDAPIIMKSISKRFGAVQALQGVDLNLYEGEVLGLVGDNAAGKSTLMKILTGVYQPDEGEIFFKGKKVRFPTPLESRRLGIEMVYQNLGLAKNLDVTSNIFLGREWTRNILGILPILDEPKMSAEALNVLKKLEIEMDSVRKRVELLSGGQQQAVAIARALSFNAKVIIMDEPTANLGVKEVDKLLAAILQLKTQGIGVVLISHRLQDIFTVGDRIMVLRRGEQVGLLNAKETCIEEIIKLIIGPPRATLA